MNKYGLLVGIQVKDGLSRIANSLGLSRFRKLGVLIVPLLLLAFSAVSFQLAYQYHEAFSLIGMPELSITLMYLFTCAFVFLFSLTSIMSTLFFSSDTVFFITLPVREDTVVFAKITIQYLVALLVSLIFLGPALLTYWVLSPASWLSYVFGIILLLLTPLIPVVGAALLVLAGMRVVSRYASRNTLTLLFSIVLLVAVLGLQILVSRQAVDEDLLRHLTEEDGLLRLISSGFPPSLWATRMFTGDLLYATWFFLSNALIALALWFLSVPLFRKAVQSFSEQSPGRIRVQNDLRFVRQRPLVVLVQRQLLIILKTPAFVLNISMLILLPVLLLVIWTFSGVMNVRELLDGFLKDYTPHILTLLIASPAIMGTFSATAITREGKNLWQVRSMPVSALTDLNARILTSLVLSLSGLLPMIGLSVYLFGFQPLPFAVGIISALAIMLSFSVLDLLVDIYRPILHWTNPTHAVKNNMNIIAALSFRLVLGVILYLARSVWLPLPMYGQILLISGLVLLIGLLAYLHILKRGVRVYSSLEW